MITLLREQYKKIKKNRYDGDQARAVYVGEPLYLLGDVFLKNLFSYTIGFEWVSKTDKYLPGVIVKFPTIIRLHVQSSYLGDVTSRAGM